VPKEMRAYWEERDPITLHEKFLMREKLLDAKGKKEIEDKISALLEKEREFAENSPFPPAEFAETGVYCTGDECHKIQPKWERPIAEVTPPKSSVKAVWTVEGFGSGKSSGGADAPIHFGDTKPAAEQIASEPKTGNGSKRETAPGAKAAAQKKNGKAAAAVASRKARR